jgi:hypothetical protein
MMVSSQQIKKHLFVAKQYVPFAALLLGMKRVSFDASHIQRVSLHAGLQLIPPGRRNQEQQQRGLLVTVQPKV